MDIHKENKVVDIDQVSPNDYNPKPDFRENPKLQSEFEKIKKSLRLHGQMDPIQVREDDKGEYIIINGYHRWLAMKEEGFKKIEVKNLGKISREEAIAKTLTFEELKIPLDYIEVAKLLAEVDLAGLDRDLLPFTEEEIDEKKALLDFNFDELRPDSPEEEILPDAPEKVMFSMECVDDLQRDDIDNNLRILMKRRGFESVAQTLQILLVELVNQEDNAVTE